MRTLVPPFILHRADEGRWTGTLTAAVLLVDATGSTRLASAMRPAGTAGAEALADILDDVFSPQVDAVHSCGGFVATFTGDGFIALFPGSAPEAVPRAMAAAMRIREHMGRARLRRHLLGVSRFEVKAVVAHGDVAWHIWRAPKARRQDRAYMFSGPAVADAQGGEVGAPPGSVLVTPQVAAELGPGFALEPRGDLAVLTGFDDPPAPDLPITVPPGPAAPGAERFVPAELIHTPQRGEFRPVVPVFVTLGSNGESVVELMHLADERGGYLCDVTMLRGTTDTGCTVLVHFGAPVTHENLLDRAVAFLLDLEHRLDSGGFRAAATFDTVFAGFVGSETQSVYTCVGAGVNLAARLAAAGDWGDLWVDGLLAERLSPAVVTAEVGVLSLAGFEDPTPVFELVGRGAPPAEVHPGPIVGRRAELATLRRWIAEIHGSGSGAVLITGEAGSGKSRLTHEMRERLGPEVAWMSGRTDAIDRTPFNPVAYLLRRWMGIQPEHSSARIRRVVERRLAGMARNTPADARELGRAEPALLSLLGVLTRDDPFRRLTPELQHQRTVEALVAVLGSAASLRPLVIHIEDGQWLDNATAELLEDVVDRTSHLPVAVLLTSRQEMAAPWISYSLAVPRIHGEAITAHLGHLLGMAPSPELTAFIERHTGGNPYYVEQTIRFMIDADLLAPSPTGPVPRRDATTVPDSLQSILIARIDGLADKVKLAVQHAAVLGREFDVPVLMQMLRDTATRRDIDRATEEGVWRAISELRHLFHHALLRDAAYEMQLRSDLRRLHSLAADAIEFVAAGEPERHAASLGHHREQAGDDRAAYWYLVAGTRAYDQFANRDAVTWLEKALVLGGDDRRFRFEVLAGLEVVYRHLGDAAAQQRVVEAMMDAASGLGPRAGAKARRMRAVWLSTIGDVAGAIEAAGDAIRLADTAGEDAESLQARGALAQALRTIGDGAGAVLVADEMARIAQQAGNALGVARSHDLHGGLAWDRGDFVTAATMHRRAADELRSVGDLVGEVRALNNLGTALWSLGDYSRALRVHEEGVARSREIGFTMAEGDNLDNLGGAYWAIGQHAEAVTHYRAALELRRRSRDAWGIGLSLSNLGTAHRSCGEYEEAVTVYREGIEIDRSIGRRRGEAFALHGLGWSLLGLGDPDGAESAFRAALDIRIDLSDEPHIVETRTGLAAVAAARGDDGAAAELVSDILPRLDGEFVEAADEPFLAYDTCIRLLETTDPDTAVRLRRDAVAAVSAMALTIGDTAHRASFVDTTLAAYGLAPP